MQIPMKRVKFGEISLSDPFFDSLKSDYQEFRHWFERKNSESALVLEEDGHIQAFLYTKVEDGPIEDVSPSLPSARRLKVGTMKVNPHGTRLGERLIKKAIDYALSAKTDEIYVTVFERHGALIDLFEEYGFVQAATKTTSNGTERVYVKSLHNLSGNVVRDYPTVDLRNHDVYLLGIYPEFHTRLFPDSKLVNESFDIVQDVSHTNSIHKVYVCAMPVSVLQPGDVLLIYRTGDSVAPARFRAVATSVCVVEEVRGKSSFGGFDEFYAYCKDYSVYSEKELMDYWSKRTAYAIKMTYNLAMHKRITRGDLIDRFGLDETERWGFMRLTKQQFFNILEAGGIDASTIVY